MMALTAITIDRNVAIRSTNARPRTNAKTIGAVLVICSLKSSEPAVMPVT